MHAESCENVLIACDKVRHGLDNLRLVLDIQWANLYFAVNFYI